MLHSDRVAPAQVLAAQECCRLAAAALGSVERAIATRDSGMLGFAPMDSESPDFGL